MGIILLTWSENTFSFIKFSVFFCTIMVIASSLASTISKVLEGKVVSRANDKTAIVLIERKVPHPRFIKRINKSKRFAVHDEENESNVGDIVEIKMCVPKSKTKKFELKAITKKAAA